MKAVLVNVKKRGFKNHKPIFANDAFIPEVRGIPYGSQFRPAHRQILVGNGTLNQDFTPNEQTALKQGWILRDPTPEEQLRYSTDTLTQK